MLFTTIQDINNLIVTFCDEYTIMNLLEVDRQLILDVKNKILEWNDIYFVANLINILVHKKEGELVKYFLEQCKDGVDDCEYREMLLEGWNPALLRIYFSSLILDQKKIFEYFLQNTECLDREEFLICSKDFITPLLKVKI